MLQQLLSQVQVVHDTVTAAGIRSIGMTLHTVSFAMQVPQAGHFPEARRYPDELPLTEGDNL